MLTEQEIADIADECYTPNGSRTMIRHAIRKALDVAGVTEPPSAAKLAALGWQLVECPICGSCARGYPMKEVQP